jgi:hypothetical protein
MPQDRLGSGYGIDLSRHAALWPRAELDEAGGERGEHRSQIQGKRFVDSRSSASSVGRRRGIRMDRRCARWKGEAAAALRNWAHRVGKSTLRMSARYVVRYAFREHLLGKLDHRDTTVGSSMNERLGTLRLSRGSARTRLQFACRARTAAPDAIIESVGSLLAASSRRTSGVGEQAEP